MGKERWSAGRAPSDKLHMVAQRAELIPRTRRGEGQRRTHQRIEGPHVASRDRAPLEDLPDTPAVTQDEAPQSDEDTVEITVRYERGNSISMSEADLPCPVVVQESQHCQKAIQDEEVSGLPVVRQRRKRAQRPLDDVGIGLRRWSLPCQEKGKNIVQILKAIGSRDGLGSHVNIEIKPPRIGVRMSGDSDATSKLPEAERQVMD